MAHHCVWLLAAIALCAVPATDAIQGWLKGTGTRGWVKFGASEYFIPDAKLPFAQAAQTCRNLWPTSYLASITTPAENLYIQNLFMSASHKNHDSELWLGVKRNVHGLNKLSIRAQQPKHYSFFNVDGSPFNILAEYAGCKRAQNCLWDAVTKKDRLRGGDEPNNIKGREFCIAMAAPREASNVGVWMTQVCGKTNRFICKRPAPQQPAQSGFNLPTLAPPLGGQQAVDGNADAIMAIPAGTEAPPAAVPAGTEAPLAAVPAGTEAPPAAVPAGTEAPVTAIPAGTEAPAAAPGTEAPAAVPAGTEAPVTVAPNHRPEEMHFQLVNGASMPYNIETESEQDSETVDGASDGLLDDAEFDSEMEIVDGDDVNAQE